MMLELLGCHPHCLPVVPGAQPQDLNFRKTVKAPLLTRFWAYPPGLTSTSSAGTPSPASLRRPERLWWVLVDSTPETGAPQR